MTDHAADIDPFEDFEGYEAPHYTQVPDQLFDEHLPHLGHAELKVLLFILRRTFGWGKEADAISLAQLERGTGLSRRSVREAVKGLEAKHLILADRTDTPRGDPGINIYRLNVRRGFGRMAEGGGKKVSRGRKVSTPGQGSKYPTVGEQVPSHPLETALQDTSVQETALSPGEPAQLAESFFHAIGYQRIPKKKRERATAVIRDLQKEGFSPEEILLAIDLAVQRGARDAGILPYVIGEAIAEAPAKGGAEAAAAVGPEPQAEPEAEEGLEDAYEEVLAEIRALPLEAQERLRQAALQRLGGRSTREAVVQGMMIGLYQHGKFEA